MKERINKTRYDIIQEIGSKLSDNDFKQLILSLNDIALDYVSNPQDAINLIKEMRIISDRINTKE
jgi:hypothetical protein